MPLLLAQAVIPADSLRAVLDSVFASDAYRWPTPKPFGPSPFEWIGRWLSDLLDWLLHLGDRSPAAAVGIRAAFAAVAVVLCLVALRTLLRSVRRARAPSDDDGPRPAARRGAGWYAARADRLAAEGNYPDALQAAFHSLVLRLDGLGLVRYHAGKTPLDYTREPQLDERGRDRLNRLVIALYGYVFRRLPCRAEDYRIWRELAEGGWHAATP